MNILRILKILLLLLVFIPVIALFLSVIINHQVKINQSILYEPLTFKKFIITYILIFLIYFKIYDSIYWLQ